MPNLVDKAFTFRIFSWLLIAFQLFVLGCRAPSSMHSTEGPTDPTPSTSKDLQSKGWESSGGDGVACFSSEEAAKEAAALVASGKGLTQALREQIKTLVTLEYWEMHDEVRFANKFLQPELVNDEKAILEIVVKTLRGYSPLFFSKFEPIRKKIELQYWEDSKALPEVSDSKPIKGIETVDPKCRLIQLAVRHTLSSKGKIPEVRLEFDKWLYENRLDALNRVILQLHEILYLIAKEGIHHDSQMVRPLVATLLSFDFHLGLMRKSFGGGAEVVQRTLGVVYGDYYNFFLDDPMNKPLVPVPAGPHQYSRYLSFGKVVKQLSDRKVKCLKDKKYEEAPPEAQAALGLECAHWAMQPDYVNDAFNEEEAFVFVARFIMDHEPTPIIDNSEHFLVWERERPDYVSTYAWDQLARACEALPRFKSTYIAQVFERAVRYCKQINPPTPRRSIMDQD